MLSIQARIVRGLLKAHWREQPFTIARIPKYRAEFERNLHLLFPTVSSAHVKRREIAGVAIEEVSPLPSPRHTILYVHGGAFVLGSSRSYRQHLIRIARMCHARVLSIDYDLAPEHPFPSAPNQVIKVWRALCKDSGFEPSKVIWMGDSAGAQIILSAALRLRDEQASLPGCLVLLSPGLDATFTGESYEKNRYNDLVLSLPAIDFYMKAYVQGHDRRNPLISPVFADLRELPPMLIQIGSDELMFSSSQKLFENTKRDGVKAALFVGDKMWHGWHLFAGVVPEAKDAIKGIRTFIDENIA